MVYEHNSLTTKIHTLKIKNNFFQSELKDRKLKDREVKIKPIILSIDDMDKFEQKEMKKIRSIKNTWYVWLISYIPESIRKSVGVFKDKVISLFKTNTPNSVRERKETKQIKNTKTI